MSLTRARGSTLLMDPPDPYGLIGLVQTVLAYHYAVYSADWQLPDTVTLWLKRNRFGSELCGSVR